MKKISILNLKKTIFCIFLFLFSSLCLADKKDDALEMLSSAEKFIKENGIIKAKEAFSKDDSRYRNGDLYPFVIDFNGKMLVHPVMSKMNGKNVINVKDPKGRHFIKEMVKIAKEETYGSVEYFWKNPTTNKLQEKITFIQKVGSTNALVAVGYYK